MLRSSRVGEQGCGRNNLETLLQTTPGDQDTLGNLQTFDTARILGAQWRKAKQTTPPPSPWREQMLPPQGLEPRCPKPSSFSHHSHLVVILIKSSSLGRSEKYQSQKSLNNYTNGTVCPKIRQWPKVDLKFWCSCL